MSQLNYIFFLVSTRLNYNKLTNRIEGGTIYVCVYNK